MSRTWYCLIGSTPALSLLELNTLFPGNVTEVTPQLYQITSAEEDADKIMRSTGGLVKILEQVKSWQNRSITPEALIKDISQVLARAAKKPMFGIHCFGFGEQIVTDQNLKTALKEQGSTSRFVDSSATGVSTALWIHKNTVFDLFLLKTDTQILLLQTVAAQNIDDWTHRDRNKPYADRKKGMLPPKVAKAMVTIGAGLSYKALQAVSTQHTPHTIYDPFCGTATVVMEAAQLGFKAFGSDISEETINQARENITWFSTQYEIPHKPELFSADAASGIVTQKLTPRIDTIVTEPFLGKPKPKMHQLPNIFKGLEKMYLGAFKRWRTILKPGSRVAIIFPTISDGKRTYTLESLIDKLVDLGYTTASGPVEYARPGAVTKRQIHTFVYQQA